MSKSKYEFDIDELNTLHYTLMEIIRYGFDSFHVVDRDIAKTQYLKVHDFLSEMLDSSNTTG